MFKKIILFFTLAFLLWDRSLPRLPLTARTATTEKANTRIAR